MAGQDFWGPRFATAGEGAQHSIWGRTHLQDRTHPGAAPIFRAALPPQRTPTHFPSTHPTAVPQSYGIKVGYGAGAKTDATAKVGEEPKKASSCC